MAIITAAGLSDLHNQRTFNKNGSTVTLKKISETDWLLFGDLAEGDSEGFVVEEVTPLTIVVDISPDNPFVGFLDTWGGVTKFLVNVDDTGWVVVEGNPLVVVSGLSYGIHTIAIKTNGEQIERIDFNSGNITQILSFGEQFDWIVPNGNFSLDFPLRQVPDVLPPHISTLGALFYGASWFNQDISGWDVSNVVSMEYMFEGATAFNQDLSRWCVFNIPTEPNRFSNNTPSWTLPKPVWGTCPQTK